MKKTYRFWLLLLSLVLAFSLTGLVACGTEADDPDDSDDTDTGDTGDADDGEETLTVLEYLETLNEVSVAEGEANVYVSDYDDVVSYLQGKGVLSSDTDPVNIIETAGYLWDGSTYAVSTEAVAFADKAYDYDGVWLIWWDISNGSQYEDVYTSMANNSGSIVVNGGQYSCPTSSYSGFYAIAFKDAVEATYSYKYGTENYNSYCYDENGNWSSDGYAQYKEALEAAVAEAEEEYEDVIEAFEDMDTTAPLKYSSSASDVAAALRSAGYISASDYVSPTNLNEVYTYYSDYMGDNVYVELATDAYQYGDITIYYFDTSNSWYSWSTWYYMFTNLQGNGETVVYYDGYYGGAFGVPWYDSSFVYTYGSDNTYDSEGTTLSYSVDLIIGSFAFKVSE